MGSWWSARNWCQAQGLKLATRADIGCADVPEDSYCTTSPILTAIQKKWGGHHWLEDYGSSCHAYRIHLSDSQITMRPRNYTLYTTIYALCH